MATGQVNTGAIEMFYDLSGPEDAPVVCLNHCFGADHRYWDHHMGAFEGFRVLRYDTRGHGLSDAPPGPYTLSMIAADIVGLLDALAIERVHFCGVSMGGMIAQTLAIEHPRRIASLMLVNTTCLYTDAQRVLWRERADKALDGGIEAVHAVLMDRWFTQDAADRQVPGYRYMAETFRRFKPASFGSVIEAMCGLDTVARLPGIKVPTMVVATPDDPGAPTEISKKMAASIPGAALHWLEPARHLATLEHPERFNALAREFLARVG
ncbi:MAG: alpha/beta fold hydrolase [Proteobacteria bacterium]|nr:alpha/beta fold hydrolase [Pseudomonadota bacterium]